MTEPATPHTSSNEFDVPRISVGNSSASRVPIVSVDAPVVVLNHVRVIDGTGAAAKEDWAYLPGLTQTIEATYSYMQDGSVVVTNERLVSRYEYTPRIKFQGRRDDEV